MVATRTHLGELEIFVEERRAHRRFKQAEERSPRAHADVEICVRLHALLCARGAIGQAEFGRGVEVQEYGRGDYAA